MVGRVTSLFDIIASPAVARVARFVLSSNANQFIHFFSTLYPAGVPRTVIARSIDGSHYIIEMETRRIRNTFTHKEFLAAINTNTKLWCSIDPTRNAILIREWETPKLLIYQEYTDRVPVSIGLSKDYVAIVSVPYVRRQQKNNVESEGNVESAISAEKIKNLPDAATNNASTGSVADFFMCSGQSLANFTGKFASTDVAYSLSKDQAKKSIEDLAHRSGVVRSEESGLANFTVSVYHFRGAPGSGKSSSAPKCELVRQFSLEFAAKGVISTVFDRADSSKIYISLEENELITIDITTRELFREQADGYPWEALSAGFGKTYNVSIPATGKRTKTLELYAPVSCYGAYTVSSSRETSTLYKNGEPLIEGFPPATCISPDSAFVWFYLNGVFYELDLHKLADLENVPRPMAF